MSPALREPTAFFRPDTSKASDIRSIRASDDGVGGLVLGSETAGRPLVVCVHGIARRAFAALHLVANEARRRTMTVFAPHFDADRYDDYQRLGRRGRGRRADRSLLDRIDALMRESRGDHDRPQRFFLIGYSAGAQFAHRFAMAHPDRVRALVAASAGWYTMPDPDRSYPRGLRAGSALPGVRFDPRAFLQVPTLVTVGSRDTECDANLRQSPGLMRTQGANRLERAHRFAEAMCQAAQDRGLEPRTRIETLPGVGHSMGECVRAGLDRRAFDFFEAQGGVLES